MALVPLRIDRTSKPPLGTPLRTDGHWSVQGLAGDYAYNESAGLTAFGHPGHFSITQGSLAGGLRLENSLDRTAGVYFDWGTFPALTIAFGYQRTVGSPSNFRRIFESSGALECLYFLPVVRIWQTLNYSHYWTFAAGFNTVVDDSNHHNIALVTDWSNFGDGYVDGKKYAGTKTGTPSRPSGNLFRIGSNSASRQPAGVLSYTYIYSRALSDIEIASLSANPWQIYEPEIIWVNVSTGTQSLTITPTGGAVAGASALVVAGVRPPTAGGAVAGGSAPVIFGVRPEVAGGAVAGGAAQVWIGRHIVAIGGAVVGGAAVVINSDHLAETWVAQGGAVAGGSAACFTGHLPVLRWINGRWIEEFPEQAVMPIR